MFETQKKNWVVLQPYDRLSVLALNDEDRTSFTWSDFAFGMNPLSLLFPFPTGSSGFFFTLHIFQILRCQRILICNLMLEHFRLTSYLNCSFQLSNARLKNPKSTLISATLLIQNCDDDAVPYLLIATSPKVAVSG